MIKKVLLFLLLVFFVIACKANNNMPFTTPEKTIEQYYYALKTSNYDLAKSCFIEGRFLVPKELVTDNSNKYEIIDKYVIGEDKNSHLYTDLNYKEFGYNKGDAQITVKEYLKPDNQIVEIVYVLKKTNNKWLIYDYSSAGED